MIVSEIEKIEQMVQQLDENPELSSAYDGMRQLLKQRNQLLIRCKQELLQFLETSNYYNSAEILQNLNHSEFLEERAVC